MQSNNHHSDHSSDHSNDPVQAKEHAALLDLVPESAATHKAIKSGSWFDPQTWENNQVPGENARVMIKSDVNVTYNGESEVQLKTVRNDGSLSFATTTNTKMVVDTLVNGPSGKLNIGTQGNAVQADKTAQILITGQGDIDTRWDPTQLSRGVISHGTVSIYGADKTDFIALQQDAKAGDRELVLSSAPKGWRVGDKLVLGGTQYNKDASDANNSRFGDEELTLIAINGNRVRFTNDDVQSGDNTALRFDHTRPNISEKDQLKLYVANTTRNVSIETKDVDGLPIQQRGHVMFMHNPNVNVQNAGFYNLGRTDKSKIVDDPNQNIDGSKGGGKNPRGRYGFHVHRAGADDINGTAAIAKGNAVVGSPGWGMVHHDSNAIFEDNVVFDVAGSGFAAESGNELGRWRNNLSMKITGPGQRLNSRQVDARKQKFDLGFNGEGYWVQGAAQVAMENNIAISTNDAGIALFSDGQGNEARDAETILIKNLPARIQALFPAGQQEVDITDVPLNKLTGFQSYNTNVGIDVWAQLANFDGQLELNNRTPNALHEGRAKIDNFKVWNNRTKGINTDYSGNIDFENGLIIGDVNDPGGDGIVHNHATHGNRYTGLKVRGFGEGFNIEFPDLERNFLATSIENSVFSDNEYNLAQVGESKPGNGALDDFPSMLTIKNTSFQGAGNNKAPVPKFSSSPAGGLSVRFDASEAYDIDTLRYNIPGKGIASYAWDFDKDGSIDQFGRQVTHHFNRSGAHEVALTVFDKQGETATIKQTVQVEQTAYTNPFVEGDIPGSTQLKKERRLSSLSADQGWQITSDARKAGGTVVLSKQGRRRAGLGQVIQNDRLHKGVQTVRFRLKNIEGSQRSRDANAVKVQLWGVNGQFDGHLTEGNGPTPAGTIPMTRSQLLERTFSGDQPFDWTDFTETVDLGQGYQYIVVQIKTDNTDDSGDIVALDSFTLSGDSPNQSEPPAPIIAPEDPVAPVEPTDPQPADPQPADPPGKTDLHKLPSLIAHFQLNEIGGKVAVDSSPGGASHSGLLRGNAIWDPGGISAGSVAFPNGDGSLDIGKSSDLNTSTQAERTVSLRFKADALPAEGEQQVIYDEGNGSRGLSIYLEGDRLLLGGWNRPAAESNWSGTWLSTDSVSAGQWHHVALVLNGENALTDGALTGYLDGQAFGAGEGSQLWARPGIVSIGGMRGGTRFESGSVGGRGYGLTGNVDEVAIFNQALSDSQIQTLAGPSLV